MLNLEPPNTEAAAGSVKVQEATQFQPDDFHERLSIKNLKEQEDVLKFYTDNFSVLSGSYGVLLFMYSVLMTKVGFTCLLRRSFKSFFNLNVMSREVKCFWIR